MTTAVSKVRSRSQQLLSDLGVYSVVRDGVMERLPEENITFDRRDLMGLRDLYSSIERESDFDLTETGITANVYGYYTSSDEDEYIILPFLVLYSPALDRIELFDISYGPGRRVMSEAI